MTEEADWQAALEILKPLEVILYAAEARGDYREALQCAYRSASEAVTIIAGEAPAACGLNTVHGVWIELTALPLVARDDGTLVDRGAYVSLEHQQYAVTDEEAAALASRLAGQSGITGGWSDVLGFSVAAR